jgi:hypothetical protein
MQARLCNDFVRDGFAYDWDSRSQFTISDGDPTGLVLSSGAHRYWRLDWTVAGVSGTTNTAFAEIEFFDQDNTKIVGGTATASSILVLAFASNARDGNTSTFWASDNGDQLGWWQIDFGVPKDVMKCRLQVRPDAHSTQGATGFNLQYSDDGATWTTAKAFTTPQWTTPGEKRSFVGFGTPVYSPIPTPAAGATTYIGGTVKFTDW